MRQPSQYSTTPTRKAGRALLAMLLAATLGIGSAAAASADDFEPEAADVSNAGESVTEPEGDPSAEEVGLTVETDDSAAESPESDNAEVTEDTETVADAATRDRTTEESSDDAEPSRDGDPGVRGDDDAPADAAPAATATWELSLSAQPASGSEVEPGEQITYTLQADVVSLRPVTGIAAGVDLSEVLAHADLVEPLAPGLSLSGDQLTWNQRQPVRHSEPATVSFAVVVDADTAGVTLSSVAAPQSNDGVCIHCTTTHTVPGAPSWDLSVTANQEPGSTVLTNAAILPTMTVQNTSAVPVSGAQVVVDLSDMGEHYAVSQVPADAVYDTDAAIMTWSVPDLEPGEGARENFQVRLSAPSRGSEVSMAFTTEGAGGDCVLDCVLTYHVSGFDASATVDVPAGVVTPGEEITYTWQVDNTSGGELTGAHVRSNLAHQNGAVLDSADLVEPLDEQFETFGNVLHWNIPDLGPGEAAEVSFSVVVQEEAMAGTDLWTQISPGTARHGGRALTDPIVHTVGVPAWEVSARAADARGITIPDGSSLRPNGQLNYHLTATNTSDVAVQDGVVTADVSGLAPYANIEALGDGAVFDEEAGTVTWLLPELAVGEEAAVSFRANLRFADAPNAVLPVSVSTQGAGGECVSGCELVHYATGFQASMSTDPPAGDVTPGEQITYTWEVQNTSQAQISGATVTAQLREVFEHAELVEPLPEELRLISITGPTLMRWDVPDLGPEETVQVSFSVVVDDDAEAGAEFGTSITAGANSFGITYGNQSISHTVGVPAWELEVTSNHDVGSTLLTNAAVLPRMTVTNSSGALVSGAQVVADLSGMGGERFDLSQVPADAVYDEQAQVLTWSVPDLEPGESITERFQVRLSPTSRGNEVSMDFATAGDGGQCVSGCELNYHVSGFDASATADIPAGEVEAGAQITYTWRVQNISGGQLTGAHLRSNLSHQNGQVLDSADLAEPLDEGLRMIGSVMNWDIPDLGPGAQAQVSFTVVVRADATAGAQMWTQITPGSSRHGGSRLTEAIVHTTGEPTWEVSARAADVRGVTIPDGSSVQPNGQLNYHLTAAHTSGVAVREATVVADVSGLMPYADIEALGAGALFDEGAGTVTWSVPDLAAGEDTTLSFRANLRFTDAPNAVLPVSVSTQGAGGECVSGCELVHYTTGFEASVLAEPAEDEVRPGAEITYVWRVENTSQAQITGAYVRAQMSGILAHAEIVALPEGVEFAVGTTLNWNVPDLGPGERVHVSFTVVVDSDAEPGTELGLSITAGPGGLGASYGEQSVSHTVAVSVTPPSSLPPVLAVLLGLAKFVFGLLIWLL